MVATESTCYTIPAAKPSRDPLSPERMARRQALIAALQDLEPVPDGPDAMQFWSDGTYFAFKPQNAWEDWLSQHAAITMMRINRAERIERKLRDLQSLRAIDCWEVDRRAAAEQVAMQLARHPNQTHGRLMDTLAGCEWLIARWEELAQVPPATWSEAQRTLASLIQPGGPDDVLAPGFAERRLVILRDLRERLRPGDAVLRDLVASGLSTEASPALVQLRRETRALHRHLKWLVGQLRVPMPGRWDNPRFRPIYKDPSDTAAPEATPAGSTSATHATNIGENNETNPPADPAADPTASEDAQAKPTAADPAAVELPQPLNCDHLAELGDAEKAARVAARKRRPNPERAVAQLRRSQRRSA